MLKLCHKGTEFTEYFVFLDQISDMMASQEKKNVKMFYTMGEVAEMFDVSQSLLRFWEKQFDVLKPRKNAKGNRQFTPEDVANLKIIYHLVKERKMTLVGAAKHIRDNRNILDRDIQLIEKLQKIRASLVEIRNELDPPLSDGSETFIKQEAAETETPETPLHDPNKPHFVELTLF